MPGEHAVDDVVDAGHDDREVEGGQRARRAAASSVCAVVDARAGDAGHQQSARGCAGNRARQRRSGASASPLLRRRSPTPAADESPTIRSRSEIRRRPTRPLRSPSGLSGRRGRRRRVRSACAARARGLSARLSLRAPTASQRHGSARLLSGRVGDRRRGVQNFGEVGLALLEERAGTPRCASALRRHAPKTLGLDARSRPSAPRRWRRRSRRLASCTAPGGRALKRSATRRAWYSRLGRRQHRGRDAAARPIASCAGERVAEQQLLGHLHVPHQPGHDRRLIANSGTSPRLVNGSASRASSLTNTKSQCSSKVVLDADRRAGDRGDDRLATAGQRLHEAERPANSSRSALRRRPRHEVVDVVARREDPRLAGDQHRADRAIGARRRQRVGGRRVHRDGERGLLLGPRDLDRRDAVHAWRCGCSCCGPPGFQMVALSFPQRVTPARGSRRRPGPCRRTS